MNLLGLFLPLSAFGKKYLSSSHPVPGPLALVLFCPNMITVIIIKVYVVLCSWQHEFLDIVFIDLCNYPEMRK